MEIQSLSKNPEIRINKSFLDFGTGFYTTTSKQHAEHWARIKMCRERKTIGCVSIYEFDLEQAKQKLLMYHFADANAQWLDFVVKNRRGEKIDEVYDMHIGPVTDDNVYRSIRLFKTGVLDKEETVKRLKPEVLQNQWVFHTKESLSFLKFIKSIDVKEEK